MENELWTVVQLAHFINASRQAVYKLVKRKQVPCIRLGRKVLFDPVKIRAWLEAHGVDAA